MGKKEESGEISIDFSSITDWFKGFSFEKKHLAIILILIPLVLSVFFRVYPAYLPVTNQWAESSVQNNIQNRMMQQVRQQYPNLPAQQQQELARQQMQQMIDNNPGMLDQNVQKGAEQLKAQLQNEDGQTYLLAIDPYYYYRHVENKLETGHYYDELKNGKPWNNHKVAPLGNPSSTNFHEQASYYIHKLVSLFNPDISFMTTFFFIPVIFSALAVIPAFFIVRRRTGNFGGFVASTLLAVHSAFLGRTTAGFADTDAYNVLFPLLITWLFLEAFEAEDIKKKLMFSGISGVLVGLFSYAWSGWWYIFDFLIAMLIVYLGYEMFKHLFVKKEKFSTLLKSENLKLTGMTGGVFLLLSGVFVSLFRNFNAFVYSALEPIKFTIIKDASKANLWPNVLTTVAELGDTSLKTIVNSMGGSVLFFIAMLGVIMTMTKRKDLESKDWWFIGVSSIALLMLVSPSFLKMGQIKYLFILALPLAVGLFLSLKREDIDVKYAIVLTVWFIGTIYAATKGMRFTLLLVPAFSVAVGLGLGMVKNLAADVLSRLSDVDNKWFSGALIVILSLFLISPISTAHKAALGEVPQMNDAWWDSLKKIDREAEADAIVNSWWDFGHWFKAIADRAVTFDGGSQNTPMAYWIGKSLLTGNEEETVGILRMLDCGSNKAFDTLYNATNNTVYSVDLLNKIVVLERNEARTSLLDNGIQEGVVDNILEKTHCSPPEDYYITSEDMVGKAGVWGHFGSWDFKKAYIYEELRRQSPDVAVKEMVEKFGYSQEEAKKLYYDAVSLTNEQQANQWIAGWPSYVTGSWTGCKRTGNNNTLTCNTGLRVSRQQGQDIVLETLTVDLENPKNTSISFGAYDNSMRRLGGSEGKPASLTVAGDDMTTYQFENSTFPYGVLVDAQEDRFMIMAEEQVKSTFTKLFFLDGRYTNQFQKFSDKTGVNGQRIIVWKVDWDGTE